MDDADIRAYMTNVPNMDRFLTVDELHAHMAGLAEAHPDITELRRVGTSTLGETINMLSIGHGSRNALLFGCPHPNEPIGAMMVVHFAQLLCDDAALRDRLDYTWHFIPCIDVDGTRLNEGWFAGPFSPANYARHYYRPAFNQQVEWTFPISYKRLYFDRTLSETEALMRVIDELRPAFMFSLHNSGFGGVYYYVGQPAPALYDTFHALPEWEGLPLHLGEPETPFMQELAPAIFRMPTARESYDYLEAHGGDPTKGWAGTSSDDYASKYGTFSLVVEMPYFDDPRVNDQSPTETIRRDAILASLDRGEQRTNELRRHFDAVVPDLRGQSPFQRALAASFAILDQSREAERHWARTSEETARPATVAELFSNDQLDGFYRLITFGQFLRMLEGEIGIGNGTPAIREHLAATRELFAQWSAELEASLSYRAIPIRKLVAVQLGAALATAAHIQESGTGTRAGT